MRRTHVGDNQAEEEKEEPKSSTRVVAKGREETRARAPEDPDDGAGEREHEREGGERQADQEPQRPALAAVVDVAATVRPHIDLSLDRGSLPAGCSSAVPDVLYVRVGIWKSEIQTKRFAEFHSVCSGVEPKGTGWALTLGRGSSVGLGCPLCAQLDRKSTL